MMSAERIDSRHLEAEDRFTRQRATLIALTRLPDGKPLDLASSLRQIVEAAAETLDVARVSIWRYSADASAIECADLFDAKAGQHLAGMTLARDTHPVYFRALVESEIIAADDALTDPHTCEFASDYLMPLGITSMLDAPIRAGGQRAGVLCHEHIGPRRQWTSDEKTFAVAMANLVSLAIETAERRQAEAAQRESVERFKAVARGTNDAVWDWNLETNAIWWNEGIQTLFGYGTEDIGPGFAWWGTLVHPEDRERVDAGLQAVLKAGGCFWSDEYRLARRDRTYAEVLDRGFVLHDEHGRAVRMIGAIQDVTERKRSEAALRESTQRFRELAETIEDVFWIRDVRRKQILYISPAYEQIWGRSCQSLYDSPHSWLDAVYPDDRNKVKAGLVTIDGASEYDIEYRILRPDGQTRWIRARSFPIRDAAGLVERVVGVARDVTDRRQLEEQFRQSQKLDAIGQLAGGVAHDFNNILAVMIMQAELVAMTENLPAEAREGLCEIRAAAERAANLTRQLLLFSRRQVMQPCDLDLNDVVTSLSKMLRRIIGEDIRLQLNLDPGPLTTRADAGMLDQVLLNLAVNARDAMPGGGPLLIRTGKKTIIEDTIRSHPDAVPGRYVWFSVSDTGKGIAPEVLPRIFEPFFTTKEPGKGTGLGLATAFGIVKQHRGWIEVASDAGRGSCFHVFIPAVSISSAYVAHANNSRTPRRGHETILLVEDDSSVRVLTRALLERYGYRVFEATNGIEASEHWATHRDEIALLLTDLVMPGGTSGQQLAHRLREDNPRLKVIFTSGYSADIAGRELELRHGETFLQKPCEPHELLESIRRCLDA